MTGVSTARPRPWRVRVRKTVEDWVEVVAASAAEAETIAAGRPGVVSVFAGSTLSAEKPVKDRVQPAVEDADDE